jgi:transporter family-2 protein
MHPLLLVVIIGLIGGVAVGFQAPLANLLTSNVGLLESVFFVHIGGALVAGIPLLLNRGGNLKSWSAAPWYAFTAGFFGLVVISAISYTIPRYGVTTSIVLVVTGQLLVGLIIDQLGWFGTDIRPLELPRLAGLILLFAGTWLVLR